MSSDCSCLVIQLITLTGFVATLMRVPGDADLLPRQTQELGVRQSLKIEEPPFHKELPMNKKYIVRLSLGWHPHSRPRLFRSLMHFVKRESAA